MDNDKDSRRGTAGILFTVILILMFAGVVGMIFGTFVLGAISWFIATSYDAINEHFGVVMVTGIWFSIIGGLIFFVVDQMVEDNKNKEIESLKKRISSRDDDLRGVAAESRKWRSAFEGINDEYMYLKNNAAVTARLKDK